MSKIFTLFISLWFQTRLHQMKTIMQPKHVQSVGEIQQIFYRKIVKVYFHSGSMPCLGDGCSESAHEKLRNKEKKISSAD